MSSRDAAMLRCCDAAQKDGGRLRSAVFSCLFAGFSFLVFCFFAFPLFCFLFPVSPVSYIGFRFGTSAFRSMSFIFQFPYLLRFPGCPRVFRFCLPPLYFLTFAFIFIQMHVHLYASVSVLQDEGVLPAVFYYARRMPKPSEGTGLNRKRPGRRRAGQREAGPSGTEKSPGTGAFRL